MAHLFRCLHCGAHAARFDMTQGGHSGRMAKRSIAGVALILGHAAVVAGPPAADPVWTLTLGAPLAAAGGYLIGRSWALAVPAALGLAGTVAIYALPAPAHTDPGPLDPLFVGAIFALTSGAAVTAGLAIRRVAS
jgi:hypothetical protein